jgi:hypothetical protein
MVISTGDIAPDERVASVRGLRERGILQLEPLLDLVAELTRSPSTRTVQAPHAP